MVGSGGLPTGTRCPSERVTTSSRSCRRPASSRRASGLTAWAPTSSGTTPSLSLTTSRSVFGKNETLIITRHFVTGSQVPGGGRGQLEPADAPLAEALRVQAVEVEAGARGRGDVDLPGLHRPARPHWPDSRGPLLPGRLHLGGAQPQGQAQQHHGRQHRGEEGDRAEEEGRLTHKSYHS